MLKIKLISNIADVTDWDEFLIKNGGSYFQSVDYFLTCKDYKDHSPQLFLAFEKEKIVGGMLAVIMISGKGIKAWFSKRLIVIGGPVIDSNAGNSKEIADELLSALVATFSRITRYIEFRDLFDLTSLQSVFEDHGFAFSPHLNYRVDLSDKQIMRKNMSTSKLRQVNKSLRSGAVIEEMRHDKDLEQWYNILNELYRTKVKKPLPSYDFFKIIFDRSLKGSPVKCFVVRYHEKIIGGIIAPVFNDTIYEWYICGQDSEHKNIYPSVLSTWAPMEYGSENGVKTFDFLGAGKPDSDYGVRDFKARFGGEMVNYGRFLRIDNKIIYTIGKTGLNFLNKLKLI